MCQKRKFVDVELTNDFILHNFPFPSFTLVISSSEIILFSTSNWKKLLLLSTFRVFFSKLQCWKNKNSYCLKITSCLCCLWQSLINQRQCTKKFLSRSHFQSVISLVFVINQFHVLDFKFFFLSVENKSDYSKNNNENESDDCENPSNIQIWSLNCNTRCINISQHHHKQTNKQTKSE